MPRSGSQQQPQPKSQSQPEDIELNIISRPSKNVMLGDSDSEDEEKTEY